MDLKIRGKKAIMAGGSDDAGRLDQWETVPPEAEHPVFYLRAARP